MTRKNECNYTDEEIAKQFTLATRIFCLLEEAKLDFNNTMPALIYAILSISKAVDLPESEFDYWLKFAKFSFLNIAMEEDEIDAMG